MKKLMLLAAGLVASIAIAACSTAQQADASANLAQLQTVVNNGCLVVQPTLSQVALLDPTVGAAATANGLFCASVAALNVTSIQTMLATGIPALNAAIAQSTLIPAAQKPLFTAAVGVFALTLTNALAVYNSAASTAAPASAPAAASTPLAGAPLQ